MLYVGKCKDCGHIVQNKDVSKFKEDMAKHRNDSHKESWLFAKQIPLSSPVRDKFGRVIKGKALHNFDCFSIVRFSDKETVSTMERIINNVGFWKAIRKYPALQNIPFSGLGDREK